MYAWSVWSRRRQSAMTASPPLLKVGHAHRESVHRGSQHLQTQRDDLQIVRCRVHGIESRCTTRRSTEVRAVPLVPLVKHDRETSLTCGFAGED